MLDRTQERLRLIGKPNRIQLDTPAGEYDLSASFRHTACLGLVATVPTTDWFVSNRCQASGVGGLLRVMVALRHQRTQNNERCRRLAQQPENTLRHTKSVLARLSVLDGEMPVRGLFLPESKTVVRSISLLLQQLTQEILWVFA